ncbi:acyltransferase [Coleofasciculus sp. LEGE 07092]|nr:acyltransferase [Coleofasciculus sp. LEGE 07081]MBE9149564.1 acyltransferase [Coleofasciculus sp. LEGE 07092]
MRSLTDEGIEIGDGVQIGRYAQLKARAGSIFIGDHTNIGSECRLDSTSEVRIGSYCLIAGRCYIGGVNHEFSRTDIPIVKQPLASKGGVRIGDDVWLGAHVIVKDGVTIGTGAVVGAGAVVTKDIPPYAIAMGVPARVCGWRKPEFTQTLTEVFSEG